MFCPLKIPSVSNNNRVWDGTWYFKLTALCTKTYRQPLCDKPLWKMHYNLEVIDSFIGD